MLNLNIVGPRYGRHLRKTWVRLAFQAASVAPQPA